MTNKKPTKKMNYEAIKKLLANANRPDLIDFCDHEIELLDNRNSAERKPTATQKANADYKTAIVAYLANVAVTKTVTDLIKEVDGFADFSNQKVSALCNALAKDGKIQRAVVGRKTYFADNAVTIATKDKE